MDPDCYTHPVCICDNDGSCEPGEDCDWCSNDCAQPGVAACGNGVCETAGGEDCLSCPNDCNGLQSGKGSKQYCCGDGAGNNPIGCSDARCNSDGFVCDSSPIPGSCCGDGVCEGSESTANCVADCGYPPYCGDGNCDPNEDSCNCLDDCGPPSALESVCDDGWDDDCDGVTDCDDSDCDWHPACQCDDDGSCEVGEDCNNCPGDCGVTSAATCGNGVCEAGDGEDCLSCPADCNGVQSGKGSRQFCCGDGAGNNPAGCSDSRCTESGYLCLDQPVDTSCCGDGICEYGESGSNCGLDCN